VVMASGSPNPKIIGARLRAAAMIPPSVHPDADLLSAFAEHCLNEAERAKILEHLAQCTICRDVIYFAQPEEEAPFNSAPAPAQTSWFAWRRLQWAALAASLSMIAAVAVYVKTNPERVALYAPATSSVGSKVANNNNKEAQPPGAMQNEAPAASYSASPVTQAAEKPDAERRESSLKTGEAQRAMPGGTVVGGLEKLPSNEIDASRPGGFYGTRQTLDDKEAAKQAYAFSPERKDVKTGTGVGIADGANGVLVANGSTAGDKDRLFDLRQQKAQGGPYANTSNANSNQIQNQANRDLYRNAESYTSNIPAAPPAPPAASPVPKPDSNLSQLSSAPASSTSASGPSGTRPAAGGISASAKPVAVTHGVVPAEEVRKKKPETIPAQSTAEGTEETVAVAGRIQDVDRIDKTKAGVSGSSKANASSSQASASYDALGNLPLNTRNTSDLDRTPVAARTTAITGWRLHHGRVQERLYGIWHDAIVAAAQPTSGAAIGGLVTVAPPQRFAGVSAVGADVWIVQAIGRGQSSLVVYRSRDAGVSWQPTILAAPGVINPGAQVNLKFINSQQGEITLSTGEEWQTSDGGAQWKFVK